MRNLNMDGLNMTPEQLVEAINQYKASHGEEKSSAAADDGAGVLEAEKQEPKAGREVPAEVPAAKGLPATGPEKKDADDLTPLIAAVEQLLAVLKGSA